MIVQGVPNNMRVERLPVFKYIGIVINKIIIFKIIVFKYVYMLI